MSSDWDYNAQPKEELTHCNLCDGTKFSLQATRDRYGLPVQTWLCDGCGLRFLNPRMTRDAYRRFYEDGVYRTLVGRYTVDAAESSGSEVPPDWVMEIRKERYAGKVLQFIGPYVGRRNLSTILDVGGSGGAVAKAVAGFYRCDVTVMEPSEAEAKEAEESGFRVIRSTVEDHEPTGETWDIVLLCRTIDHLTDIKGSLKTLRAMMHERSIMFVDGLLVSELKVDHPFYLTEETMLRYLEAAGLRVLTKKLGPTKLTCVVERK